MIMKFGRRVSKSGLCRHLLPVFAALIFSIAAIVPAEARKYAALVMDAKTGIVLYQSSASAKVYPASLTKMMTAYLTFEALEKGKLKLGQKLKVSRRAARQPASKLGLRAGSYITVEDALKAIIVKSANDAATVLAEAQSKTEHRFAVLMTARARMLGMKNTRFMNASGLPDRRQKTTARDMAKLGLALIRDFPEKYKMFGKRTFKYKGRTYRSTNKLLDRFPGVDGIKTGYINASGFNLVATSVRNDRRIIAAIFGGRTGARRDRAMTRLLHTGFAQARKMRVQLARAAAAKQASVPPARPTLRTSDQTTLASSNVPVPQARGATASDKSLLRFALFTPAQAAPRPPRRVSYGIQVGAFSTERQALAGISRARKQGGGILDGRTGIVEPIERKKRKTLYRARLLSFDKAEANFACGELNKLNIPCMSFRVQG